MHIAEKAKYLLHTNAYPQLQKNRNLKYIGQELIFSFHFMGTSHFIVIVGYYDS